ncbi:ABC transporter substrate-binding protein [Allokutzneria albata]|uniref:ABC-type glycerol-3-phosphate transport system, substrate-binding protein n=1 Tax=Allokutzneria albata TaxID=211114 RepID=A0A1G9VG15_ALLAB|nr:sugar ABC transporter substrate-binding protein [Allokutzneria albata]SDM71208.1 ABC-type glycerol-3-phosphate transport system, substrate-binding protein [Allokutzneria albata]
MKRILVLMVLALVGCSATPKSDVVKLRFLSLAWQKESVAVNKQIVAEWNRTHPRVQVEYVPGSWDSIHDQLLTSFAGGEAADVIHNSSDDLSEFAHGGYLADLTTLLPAGLKADIPEATWETTRFKQGVYGVPFLQEPKVILANRALLTQAGVRFPTPDRPWTWDEFAEISKKLTRDTSGDGKADQYGFAWPMKQPVSTMLNLALNFDGRFFYPRDGKVLADVGPAERQVLQRVHAQLHTDGSAAPGALGMSGSDSLPGFFAGKYAMVSLGLSYRQQMRQQAPKGFDWVTLPPLSGTGPEQGVSPQTLSISEDSPHKREAMEFIDHLVNPRNTARLALGDWMLPTSTKAMAAPELNTTEFGWNVGVAAGAALRTSPSQRVRGYAEWKDKIATPAFQQYFRNQISIDELSRKLTEDGNRVLARYQR